MASRDKIDTSARIYKCDRCGWERHDARVGDTCDIPRVVQEAAVLRVKGVIVWRPRKTATCMGTYR